MTAPDHASPTAHDPCASPSHGAPLLRLDEARARNTRGLGLGLAIVAQAIEREGGRLVLANRPEGGLRAGFRLRIA